MRAVELGPPLSLIRRTEVTSYLLRIGDIGGFGEANIPQIGDFIIFQECRSTTRGNQNDMQMIPASFVRFRYCDILKPRIAVLELFSESREVSVECFQICWQTVLDCQCYMEF